MSTTNEPHAERSKEARAFDLGQPRSAGVLSTESVEYCRRRGIPLGYDPLQIGWVVATCVDDFAQEPASLQASGDSELRDRANRAFDARCREILQGEPDAAQLWAAAAYGVRSLDAEIPKRAKLRGALLFELQQKAARLIADQVIPESQRAAFRRETRAAAERFVLRRWRETDRPRFRALLDDARVWRYLPEPYPDPLDDAAAAALIRISAETERHDVRAIVVDGAPVGQVRLELIGRHVERGADEAELSYWLGADYWGRGIARDVVRLFTLQTFESRPMRSVFARVHVDNRASIKLLENAAYRWEGALRAEIDAEPGIRTYRAFRSDYLGQRARRSPTPQAGATVTR